MSENLLLLFKINNYVTMADTENGPGGIIISMGFKYTCQTLHRKTPGRSILCELSAQYESHPHADMFLTENPSLKPQGILGIYQELRFTISLICMYYSYIYVSKYDICEMYVVLYI